MWKLKTHGDVIEWKHFLVTGPLCGEFIGHRWIPLTKASDAELWCFLWSAPSISRWVNNREAGGLRHHLPQRLFAVWHDGSLSSQAKEFATNVSKPCIIYQISHWCGPINRLPPYMWSVKFTYTWSCPTVYTFQSSTALLENTKRRKSTLTLVCRGS